MVGCDHRDNDPEAVMYPTVQGTDVELNMSEKSLMETTPCPVWGW